MSGAIYYDEGGIEVRVKDDGEIMDQVRLSVEDEDDGSDSIQYLSPEDAIILGQKILVAGLDARESQRRKARDEAMRRGVQPDLALPPYVSDADSAFRLRDGVPDQQSECRVEIAESECRTG